MVDSVGNNGSYYVRVQHFDNERMAGTVAHWKNNTSSQETSDNALSMLDGDTKSPNINAPKASFGELLDVMNPLHHLPIVGNIYRNMTGDEISPVAQIIGGTVYGGGIGGLSAITSAAIREHTGEDGLASAVISSAKSDKVEYGLIDDERSAGMNKPRLAKLETLADVSDAVEVASVLIPRLKPTTASASQSYDIFDKMEDEKREPVTRVSIDIAMAEVVKPKHKQFNFNA